MAAINRGQSPMLLYEECLERSKDESERQKRRLSSQQKIRSPFLVGSIDELNRKISRLDRRLQSYTQLVVETRASETPGDFELYEPPPSARGREIYQNREKETKRMNQFAGLYSMQSILVPDVSDRVKNISKISMNADKAVTKKDTGKPKFVELHQYPGFEPSEITPLPQGTVVMEILQKTTLAQTELSRKPKYKPVFEKLFYSEMSQAILQDMFWWVFLDRFHASEKYQPKLFNRVAHNYVKLMTYAKQFRDVFFQQYPNLLSQALYAAFCDAFPDSYRLFGEDFREEVLRLVHQWFTGVTPVPRLWLNWNYNVLEPANIKTREEMINQNKKDKKSSNCDFLDSHHSSQSTLNQQSSSRASQSSLTRTKEDPEIADPPCDTPTQCKQKLYKTKSKPLEESLSPIRELEEGIGIQVESSRIASPGDEPTQTKSNTSQSAVKLKPRNKSHPAQKGPDFVKTLFNLNGQSPLVAHFLKTRQLSKESGTKVRIQRTELENLPPLDAPTYQDVIRQSFINVRETEKNYQALVDEDTKESAKFIRKMKKVQQADLKKETALLSNSKEVKRLSDLLILEMKKDHDSITVGADAAIQDALKAQECHE